MAQDISTITRRTMVAGLALRLPNNFGRANKHRRNQLIKVCMRAGGVSIAAVVDHLDARKNPIVGRSQDSSCGKHTKMKAARQV